jgi:hypothetical protein
MTDLIPKEALISWVHDGSDNALGLATVGWDQDIALYYGLDLHLIS